VRITNLAEGTLQIRKISTSNTDFQVTGILLPVVVAHGTSENFTISFRPKGRAAGTSDFDFHEFRAMPDGTYGASLDDQGTDRIDGE